MRATPCFTPMLLLFALTLFLLSNQVSSSLSNENHANPRQQERLLQNTLSGPEFPWYANGDCDAVPSVMTVSFGYYQSWSKYREADCYPVPAEIIDVSQYTHLAYSFAWISEAYELEPYNANYKDEEPKYAEFVGLKKKKPELKTLISVGGWTFSDPGPTERRWTEMVNSDVNRAKFVASAVRFILKYDFDGIELDWEFPGGGRGGQPSDKQMYAQLVFDLRRAFDEARDEAGGRYLEVSMSVPVVRSLLDVGYDLPALADGLDFMNLLTYDLHGVWEEVVGAHSDLVDIFGYLEYFIQQGVPPHKMVLGLALYARTYTMESPDCVDFGCPFNGGGPGGCLNVHSLMPYYIVDDHIQAKDYNTMNPYNPSTGSATLVFDDNILVTYDSPESLSVKAEYAKQACFHGVMWWAVDMARETIVLEQLNLDSSSNPPPTTTKPTSKPTQKPTTMKPTTPEPTTTRPTTNKPTTAEPTTNKPTTAEPTTIRPTTAEPTTIKPTTAVPTTTNPVAPPSLAPDFPQAPTSTKPSPAQPIAPVSSIPSSSPETDVRTRAPFATTAAESSAPSAMPSKLQSSPEPSSTPSSLPSSLPSTTPSMAASDVPPPPSPPPPSPPPPTAVPATLNPTLRPATTDVPSSVPSVNPTVPPTVFPWPADLTPGAVQGPGASSSSTTTVNPASFCCLVTTLLVTALAIRR